MQAVFDRAQGGLLCDQLLFESLADSDVLIVTNVSSRTQIEVVIDTIEQAARHSQEMPAVVCGPIACEAEGQHRHHSCMIGENAEETRVVLTHKTRDLIDPL